jgi:hypothetical protein
MNVGTSDLLSRNTKLIPPRGNKSWCMQGVRKPVELMHMEMFVGVVEDGGVRAAECVFRTEPAVSVAKVPDTGALRADPKAAASGRKICQELRILEEQ